MNFVLVIEVFAKSTFDGESAQKWKGLTDAERSERISAQREYLQKWFISQLDDGAEVTVNFRVEEVIQ